MEKIVYTRVEDNGVSIVIPAPKSDLEKILGSMTDNEYKRHVWDRSVPQNSINARYIDDEDIPENREFRDAWELDEDGNIYINIPKAAYIKKAQLLILADEVIKDIDQAIYLTSLEGDTVGFEELVEKRNKIINLKNTLDLSNLKTVSEISNYMPIELLDSINFEDIAMRTKMNLKAVEENAKASAKIQNNQKAEFEGAILAIKGFLMEIPNIQKSLLELKDMIQPK